MFMGAWGIVYGVKPPSEGFGGFGGDFRHNSNSTLLKAPVGFRAQHYVNSLTFRVKREKMNHASLFIL